MKKKYWKKYDCFYILYKTSIVGSASLEPLHRVLTIYVLKKRKPKFYNIKVGYDAPVICIPGPPGDSGGIAGLKFQVLNSNDNNGTCIVNI